MGGPFIIHYTFGYFFDAEGWDTEKTKTSKESVWNFDKRAYHCTPSSTMSMPPPGVTGIGAFLYMEYINHAFSALGTEGHGADCAPDPCRSTPETCKGWPSRHYIERLYYSK